MQSIPHGHGSPILVVEDNDDDAFTLNRALQKLGLANPLQFATDGRQAIEYLARSANASGPTSVPKPLLVLLDLKIPYKDGFQVLEWIRNTPDLSDLAVVMLTGSDEPRDLQRAYALGARSYLVKPATVDDIRRIFESLEPHWQRVGERPTLASTTPAKAP